MPGPAPRPSPWESRDVALLAAVVLSCGCALPTEAASVRQALHLDVPMPPTPVTVLGTPRLVYELHLTNFAREPRAPSTPLDPGTEPERVAELPSPNAVARLGASSPTPAPGGEEGGRLDDTPERRLFSRLDTLWNARDARGFSELFTAEGSFEVVGRGELLDGRAAINAHFAERFPAIAPQVRHRTTVREVREVTPGIRAVDGAVEIVRTPSGGGAESTLLQRFAIAAVVVANGDDWRIHFLRAFQLPTEGEAGEPPRPETEGQ